MEPYHRDAAEWAEGVARDLKLVAVSAADECPATRRSSMVEMLSDGLKGVAPSDRETYLQALAARFPVADDKESSAAGDGESVALRPVPEDTPESLLERLVQASARLEPRARRTLLDRLAVGMGLDPGSPAVGELAREVAGVLGLRPGEGVPAERLAGLISALVQPLLSLDQLMQSLRQRLSTQPGGQRRPGGAMELKEAIRKYLAGEPDSRVQQVELAVQQCAKTVARLLHVVGGAGRDFARAHHARFAPSEIKERAEYERGGGHIDQRCWRVYVRCASEFWTEAAIEKEIQDAIAARLRDFTSV